MDVIAVCLSRLTTSSGLDDLKNLPSSRAKGGAKERGNPLTLGRHFEVGGSPRYSITHASLHSSWWRSKLSGSPTFQWSHKGPNLIVGGAEGMAWDLIKPRCDHAAQRPWSDNEYKIANELPRSTKSVLRCWGSPRHPITQSGPSFHAKTWRKRTISNQKLNYLSFTDNECDTWKSA
jgi:hypothetical protein